MSTAMRAKMRVHAVNKQGETSEQIRFGAVAKPDGYPADGSDEDNTFARYTPSADLSIVIQNPALVGKFAVGDTFYVDFTPVEQPAAKGDAA